MTAPNKPGNNMHHNKHNVILLTEIRDLLVHWFVGGFDQNPAVLGKALLFDLSCYQPAAARFLCSILVRNNVNCIYRHVKCLIF